MPKWSWQKKQERTEQDWAGAFCALSEGGEKRRRTSFFFLFLPFSKQYIAARLLLPCPSGHGKRSKRGPRRGWIVTSYCCWVRSEIELLSGGRLATFFSHPFLSKQERLAHFSLSILSPPHPHTGRWAHLPGRPLPSSNPRSHQHEQAQLAPQGAQEQRKALREALCCSAAAKTRFRPRGLRRLLGHNRRGHSSRSSPRRRLRTRARARARARALRPRRATARGRQRRDFARRGARTRAIVG